MEEVTIQALLAPQMIAMYTVVLTQLAKKLKCPSKYLPFIATFIGALSAFVLSFQVETLNTMTETFKGFGIGLAATMLLAVAKDFKSKK